ncbi:MAG: hypothetical protein ACFFDI_00135 [Promethearchaeota archaeon]
MSKETKEFEIFILVGSGVLVLEGILICLFSAAGVLVPPSLSPLAGISIGIVVFSFGVLILLVTLARSKGWLKETIDERHVKMAYKAAFHAFFIMMFVAANLVFLDLNEKLILPSTTGLNYVIWSGSLAFIFSMAIQEFFQFSYR